MSIYLIKDYVRVDGVTGQFIEREHVDACERFERELTLHSARNQYISFQVVVHSDDGQVDSAELVFGELHGPGGTLAPDTEVFIEWFHETENQAIPDCLVPLSSGRAFRVPQDDVYLPGQQIGAFWVDWFVPKGLKPGEYAGTFRVKANETVQEFDLRIIVHAVTVPDKSLMTADLNAYADSISPLFPHLAANPNRYEDGSFFEVEQQLAVMAREHRALYHNLGYKHSGAVIPSFAPELVGAGKNIRVNSWELFDRHYGPYLDGTAFRDSRRGAYPIEYLYLPFHVNWPAHFEKWGKKGFRTEVRRIMAEFVRHFEEKGWTETGFEIFLNHKKHYRFYPFSLDEIWYEHDEEPFEQFYDMIKGTYDSTNVRFLFMTQFTRSVHAFMADVDGFCVWNAFGHGTSDYLKEPIADEIIMYPGVRFGILGPLPSIRLKFLRNTMQLMDVLMVTNGYEFEIKKGFKRQVKDIVNKQFGFLDDGGWWKETPEFVNTPPRYWDFSRGGLVEYACSPDPAAGKSPRMIERLKTKRYVVRPKVIDDVLHNPGIGFMTYQRFNGDKLNVCKQWTEGTPIGDQPFDGDLTNENYPRTTLAYFRLFWRFIEPEPEQYNWELIDKALATAKERKQTLLLRIAPYGELTPEADVPDWYRQLPGIGGNSAQPIPRVDPEDARYIYYFGGMIRALGRRYDGHPDLESVDVAIVGPWGEGAGADRLTDRTREALVNAYTDSFRETPLLMLLTDEKSIRYGRTRRNVGFRGDCLGDMGGNWSNLTAIIPGSANDYYDFPLDWSHMMDFYPQKIIQTGMQDAWRKAPVSFEVCWVVKHWRDRNWDIDYIIDQSLKWHISSFDAKSSPIPKEWEPQIQRWLNKMGYRLALRKLTYPCVVEPGGELPITTWWENLGVAPCYRKFPLVLRLMNDEHQEVLQTGADIREWLPGDSLYDQAIPLPATLPAGCYRLSLALVNPLTDEPAIQLAVEGRGTDGWYELGDIEVSGEAGA